MKKRPKVPGMRRPINWRRKAVQLSDELLEQMALSSDVAIREAARDELTVRYMVRHGGL